MTQATTEPLATTNLAAPRNSHTPSWPELISLAIVMALSADAIPYFGMVIINSDRPLYAWVLHNLNVPYLYCLLELAFGLLIVLPTARRSGLRLGTLRGHAWQVAFVVAVPIILTALIYPRLPTRPFTGASSAMWTVTPPAEDMIFCGYIYGLLAQRGAKRFVRFLPINPAVLITALLFGLYHAPNMISLPLSYTLFQVLYTAVGAMWTGMTRVWTGTFLYVTIAHAAVNFIAWRTP